MFAGKLVKLPALLLSDLYVLLLIKYKEPIDVNNTIVIIFDGEENIHCYPTRVTYRQDKITNTRDAVPAFTNDSHKKTGSE